MTTNRLELSRKRFAHVRRNQNVFSMVNANIPNKAHYVIIVYRKKKEICIRTIASRKINNTVRKRLSLAQAISTL